MVNNGEDLQAIYEDFEAKAAAFKANAACERGCAFCCSDAGTIDITTMEGHVIQEKMRRLPRPRQKSLNKALSGDRKKREKGHPCACPFLTKSRICKIYDIRPFACRRIYSVKICSQDDPPMLNSKVMELARESIHKLQQLDYNGYSGHISYILEMLSAPRFRQTYLSGELKPEEVMQYGQSHRIVINKMMVR